MRRKTTLWFLAVSFCLTSYFSGAQNLNLSNSPYWDGECNLSVNPLNPKHLVSAWMYYSLTNFKNAMATRTSFDGGQTWSTLQILPHVYHNFTCADPTIYFGKDSCVYLAYIDLSGLSTGDSGYIMVARSVNGGITWRAPVKAISWNAQPNLPIDRPWIAADRSNGPYSGRVYVTSQNAYFTPQPHHPWFTYSTDSGSTWSPIVRLDDSIPSGTVTDATAFTTVAANGTFYGAYVSYYTPYSPAARIVLVKSFNGGASFTPYIVFDYALADQVPVADSLLKDGFSLSSNPADTTNLIFTTVTNHFGEPDVVSYNTHNAGVTWSGPVRVNDDLMGAYDTCHDLAWGSFAPNGKYGIAWRDRRKTGQGDTTGFQIYGSTSNNGGNSFTTNFLISDTISPPVLIPHGDDFLGCAVTDSNIYALWSTIDVDEGGKEETFFNATSFSKIPASVISVSDNASVKIDAYPNPFHNETNIVVNSSEPLHNCTLMIYSMEGKKVGEVQIPGNGTYKLNFTYPAGTYIWTIMEKDTPIVHGKWIIE